MMLENINNDYFFILEAQNESFKTIGVTYGILENNTTHSGHMYVFENGKGVGRVFFDAKMDYAFAVEKVEKYIANPISTEGEKIALEKEFEKQGDRWILTREAYEKTHEKNL